THNLLGVSLPSGQSAGLNYYSNGFLSQIEVEPQGLFVEIPAYTSGLPQIVHRFGTNLADLWLTNFWDTLNRPTGVRFTDGSSSSNVFTKLDLSASKDRLGNWTYLGHNNLQFLTSITDTLSNTTQLAWCECGSLQSVTDAVTNLFTLNYNNQGILTNISLPDNSSLTTFLDSAGRPTSIVDGLNRGILIGYNNHSLATSVSNAYGRVWRVLYDAVDRPIEFTDASNVSYTNSFDLVDRILTRFRMDGVGESFGWAANGLLSYTNGLLWYTNTGPLRVTRFGRDGAGRLLSVANPNLETNWFNYNALSETT